MQIRDEGPQWSDDPATTADISGRPAFVSAVAARIDRVDDRQASTVFGLVGPWGSGKTTLLRDVAGRLSDWTPVWFSPWSVSDVGALTGEFLAALSEAFPRNTGLKQRFASYSRFGVPALKAIPMIGDAVAGVASEVVQAAASRPAWHTEFESLSEEIAAEGRRVLVIVDDVDRLDESELRALLRVIRLLGRFRNVHYLIAYDQATIDDLLGAGGGRSADFMEKIVQYPFEVPPVPTVVRRRWARAAIDVHLRGPDHNAELAQDIDELVRILAAGIETPRAAERLREQLASLGPLADAAELDPLDFTVVSWLRIAHHDVWDALRRNGEEFKASSTGTPEEAQDTQRQLLAGLVRRGDRAAVHDAIAFLFESSTPGMLVRPRRLRSHRHFDRYFLLNLAEDDVSDLLVERALDELIADNAGAQAEQLRALVCNTDSERASLALDLGLRLRQRATSTSQALIDFLDLIRTTLRLQDTDIRRSPLERWEAREILLALATGVLAPALAVARFGYEFLTACAYGVRRFGRLDDALVQETFLGIARLWVDEVASERLATVLARPETATMTSFLTWLKEPNLGDGYLAAKITSAEELITTAQCFVSRNVIYGVSAEFDITFRDNDFIFAAGSALAAHGIALPMPNDGIRYEIADRSTPQLVEDELWDFAVRNVRRLAGHE